MAERKVALTATGNAYDQRGKLKAIIVTTALGAGAVTVYDNTSASGTVLFVIPASAAVGVQLNFPDGIPLDNGIHAVFASAGTVLFVFD